ncbi:MAG: hypothetical protein KDJ47_05555 [Hyphomicrobiaceae bacterium]|nr:hypothetical protein [Hyphomicrobiaceae bacterium]
MDIHLNDFEIALFDSIAFPPDAAKLDGEQAANNAELARLLAVSILEREAVPEHRLRFFDEAEHNLGRDVSVRAELEQSGVSGEQLYEQADFLKYLRYFICGPELPEAVERVFRRELGGRDGGSQRRLAGKLKEFGRSLGATAAQREKFYQQALECGLSAPAAREIAFAALPAD